MASALSAPHFIFERAAFDLRYPNPAALGYNDVDRANVLLVGIFGKRLTYKTIGAR